MTGCPPFSIRFDGDLRSKMDEALKIISDMDFVFNGDENGGSLKGNAPYLGPFEGWYEVSGDIITVHVIKKPQFIGCHMIEGEIRNFLNR